MDDAFKKKLIIFNCSRLLGIKSSQPGDWFYVHYPKQQQRYTKQHPVTNIRFINRFHIVHYSPLILVMIESMHAAILANKHFFPLSVECESFVVKTLIVFLCFDYAICLFIGFNLLATIRSLKDVVLINNITIEQLFP